MSIFLAPFVDMINRITEDGIPCVINEKNRILRLYIVSCCVDSVARAPMQRFKQFNGKCACNWCLQTATPRKPINGIKYPSPFIHLSSFNIITGFVPDYMHCALEGVAKQITEYFVASMNKDDIREIDLKLNKITAPHQIARLSQPISCRGEWNAREWENWTLYYSSTILAEHLSRDYYLYWLLFVESLYILLQDDIEVEELNRAHYMLHDFVEKTEEYFGKKAMTYNVHQSLHMQKVY